MIAGSIAIFISFIASLLVHKKMFPKWLRLFPYYLLFTMIVQIGGYFYSHITKHSNHFIFNIRQFIDYSFWLYVFLRSYQTAILKKIVGYASLIFFAFAFYNLCFGEGFFIYNSMTDTFGSTLMIVFPLIYLGELFKSKTIINYFKIPMFWISSGLLFFSIGGIIYLCMFDYITAYKLDSSGKIYNVILVTLNIFMYGLFTVCFLCNHYLWKKDKF